MYVGKRIDFEPEPTTTERHVSFWSLLLIYIFTAILTLTGVIGISLPCLDYNFIAL